MSCVSAMRLEMNTCDAPAQCAIYEKRRRKRLKDTYASGPSVRPVSGLDKTKLISYVCMHVYVQSSVALVKTAYHVGNAALSEHLRPMRRRKRLKDSRQSSGLDAIEVVMAVTYAWKSHMSLQSHVC